jgi:hypothetical protein
VSDSRALAGELASDRAPAPSSLWQIYLLLGILAAAVAVWVTSHTQPAALILLSAAVLAAGFVALAVHRAAAALLGRGGDIVPVPPRRREMLEKEKALVLRSIKELEFDRAMGKIGEADFTEIDSRLRARALALMQDLERAAAQLRPAAPGASSRRGRACGECGTTNDLDARFCKQCGSSFSSAS